MILTGSEDIRIRKTITAIQKTFYQMLCEMDYKKITVKELCARAMINKKTFYTYYETLDYLLRETQESYAAPFIVQVGKCTLPDDIGRLTKLFFEFSASQDKTYEKITCATTYSDIRNEMINTVSNKAFGSSLPTLSPKLTAFQNKILFNFWYQTNIMIYREWINHGKKVPLNEIIELACGLVLKGIENFTKAKSKN